jgi:hypothetical protein
MSDAVITEASLIARRKGNGLLLAKLICSFLPPFEPWRHPRTRLLPSQTAPSDIGLDRIHKQSSGLYTLHITNTLHYPSPPQSSTSRRWSANSSITSLFKATNPTVGTILITAPNGNPTSAWPGLFLFPGDRAATLTLLAATTALAPLLPRTGCPRLPPSPGPIALV